MKRVYLVRESGERLGPYDWARNDGGWARIPSTDMTTVYGISHELAKILGFTIEESLPEKITVTQEEFVRVWKRTDNNADDLWRELCAEALGATRVEVGVR